MQNGHYFLLHARLEVDEKIPAGDQIHLRERRIARQVLARKDAHFAHRFIDAVPPIHLHKKPPEALRGLSLQQCFPDTLRHAPFERSSRLSPFRKSGPENWRPCRQGIQAASWPESRSLPRTSSRAPTS